MLTSQKIVYAQESTVSESSTDTICLSISTVKMLAASHEKYIFADSLIKIQDEEIFLLQEVVEEKVHQAQLNENLLHGFRNEIEKLRRQRLFLGVGLGVSVVGILLIAF